MPIDVMPAPAAVAPTHLGDGLYADHDGFQIRLYADRAEGRHEVFLEPSTLQNFLEYVVALKKGRG